MLCKNRVYIHTHKHCGMLSSAMGLETKRVSDGYGVVFRNVGNVANVGDREDKE